MTHIQEKIEQYIDSRLPGRQDTVLYRNARRMKRRHLQNGAAAAIGAVLIPVVSNLPWEIPFGSTTIQVSTMGASLIGLGVALILALEGVFHFKEQWQNCRGTEQYLLSQRFRFENRVDEYQRAGGGLSCSSRKSEAIIALNPWRRIAPPGRRLSNRHLGLEGATGHRGRIAST